MPAKESKGKIVILHSGGLDSSCLLYYVRNLGFEPLALSFDYGQRHKRELYAAEAVAYEAKIPHYILKIPALGELGHSSQTDLCIPVPEGHYTDENMKITVVPNRNMILLAFAAAYAMANDAKLIGIANHAGDHAIYPDCRPDFVLGMQTILQETWGISLKAPFTHHTKSDIVLTGQPLMVPFHLTFSCYNGQIKHCGKCGTCVERKEAFKLAEAKDPTQYEA